MMALLVDATSWICILLGLFFMIVGAIGVLRLPDVFTRLHAAGMTDTMGAGFILVGLAVQAGARAPRRPTAIGLGLPPLHESHRNTRAG